MDNCSYNAIRCPDERKHNIYDLCGKLLGAEKDGIFYYYCNECHRFYKIVVESDGVLSVKPLPKKERLKLKNALRIIDDS